VYGCKRVSTFCKSSIFLQIQHNNVIISPVFLGISRISRNNYKSGGVQLENKKARGRVVN
jgi:hypothetical protein